MKNERPSHWNRRDVLGLGALAGAALATGPIARAVPTLGAVHLEDRMTPYPATWYRAYTSKGLPGGTQSAWVQVDLGTGAVLDAVRLYPHFDADSDAMGFPERLRVEGSNNPDLSDPVLLFDDAAVELPQPKDRIVLLSLAPTSGRVRYVRLTATRLRTIAVWDNGKKSAYGLSFAKIEVLSNGRDVAVTCPVTADPLTENPSDLQHLTRRPRPAGEGIVTDNPGNVTRPETWRAIPFQAQAPKAGVEIGLGLFRSAMEQNIEYLLTSFSLDEMLRPFRERAGKPVAAGLRPPIGFWDTELPGSSAGRFLMGAGNTLRWIDHPALRKEMNAMVDGIAECRQSNGYMMGYPEEAIMRSERAGYTRAWVTHGLLEAAYAGRTDAFELLRGYYDWFDTCEYLPRLLRGTAQGVQGMVANTRMYLSPVGKPADVQVVQRYFQEDYWLDGLARLDENMVWQYPYDRPHNYLLTDIEAYLDLYRITGDNRYRDAVVGAWKLYHERWEHVGGSIAITENGEFPPGSYRLMAQFDFCETGELCGSSFWAFLNQRLHLLKPDEEKYVTEIEKSIYNIGIANQFGSKGLFYHARLVGKKGDHLTGYCTNSCCEGQGTRLIGSIPEHIYSIVEDGPRPGVYVNLFAPSSIHWRQKSGAAETGDLKLTMKTSFPDDASVELHFQLAEPKRSVIRVRTPAWANAAMPVHINGVVAASGTPGGYVDLDRVWHPGDVIGFRLPIGFRLTRYTGTDQVPGYSRYALEYGPILMAIEGSDDPRLKAAGEPEVHFVHQLEPAGGDPLRFALKDNPGHTFVPYYRLKEETFSCFPVIDHA